MPSTAWVTSLQDTYSPPYDLIKLACEFRLQGFNPPPAAIWTDSFGRTNLHRKEIDMHTRSMTLVVLLVLFAGAAAAQDYPMLNMVAEKVIEKYQRATCEQLWESRNQPKPEMEQRLVQFLRTDPQMRKVFIDKVSPTVVNKMFECGMVP